MICSCMVGYWSIPIRRPQSSAKPTHDRWMSGNIFLELIKRHCSALGQRWAKVSKGEPFKNFIGRDGAGDSVVVFCRITSNTEDDNAIGSLWY